MRDYQLLESVMDVSYVRNFLGLGGFAVHDISDKLHSYGEIEYPYNFIP